MMQIRDLVTASTGISLIPYSCPCKTQLSFWACKPQLFVWNLQHLPYSCGCLEDRERDSQERWIQKVGGWKYQDDTLGQERQNQGKLTMKTEVMNTNQKDPDTGMQPELLETKQQKIVMEQSKHNPFSLCAAMTWQKDRGWKNRPVSWTEGW